MAPALVMLTAEVVLMTTSTCVLDAKLGLILCKVRAECKTCSEKVESGDSRGLLAGPLAPAVPSQRIHHVVNSNSCGLVHTHLLPLPVGETSF